MNVGEKRVEDSGNGCDDDDNNYMENATRIMESAQGFRRRPSASSFNDNPSRSDRINDEESRELLQEREDDSQERLGPAAARTSRQIAARRDGSKWLQTFSIVFGILILATIAYFGSNTLVRSSRLRLDIFNIFHIGGEGAESFRKIGIELHPMNHVFRPPKTSTYHWIITSGFRSPDGVKKAVYMVNGEFPGPTIQCRSGDKLVVVVTNDLADEGVSIHWHGLQMRNANAMDGAIGFTQCSIPPGEMFTYEFDVDAEQSGTFWWHAHSQTQRGDGLYGGLVVHTPADVQSDMELFGYEKEMLLLIGDWYHRNGNEVLEWYTSVKGFGNEPVPDSLLINGVGNFVCSMAVPARPVECKTIEEEQFIGIPAEGPSRIRVVNVGTLAGFTLQVDFATLTPITVDGGHAITGSPVDSVGILYPGERVDMISNWKAEANSHSPRLLISMDRENFKYPNQALRPDQSFTAVKSSQNTDFVSSETDSQVPVAHFDLASATAAISTLQLFPTAQENILLYTKTEKLSINANHPQGFMNRTSWVPQTHPLISLPRASWDSNQLIPFIPFSPSEPLWVDIIINNLDDGAHPFHLHGHDFYVLASHRSDHGWGSYSPWAVEGSSSMKPKLNLENPCMKDTVSVPRRGYVVLRFRADNRGIWMLHCHVLFHQGSGMAMGLHIGEDKEHKNIDFSSRDFCTKLAE